MNYSYTYQDEPMLRRKKIINEYKHHYVIWNSCKVHKEVNYFVYHLKCMGEIMRVVTYIGREEMVTRKGGHTCIHTHTHMHVDKPTLNK